MYTCVNLYICMYAFKLFNQLKFIKQGSLMSLGHCYCHTTYRRAKGNPLQRGGAAYNGVMGLPTYVYCYTFLPPKGEALGPTNHSTKYSYSLNLGTSLICCTHKHTDTTKTCKRHNIGTEHTSCCISKGMHVWPKG